LIAAEIERRIISIVIIIIILSVHDIVWLLMVTSYCRVYNMLQFLPHSCDNIVASSAADCKIRVHDVTSHEVLHVFGCHAGRVKRLATSPSQPNVFWSASEDGTIM